MSGESKKDSGKMLPYVSYSTFNTAITAIVNHGIPPTIDRSVLKTYSGANQGLILKAFQYLGLTDQQNRPTESFKSYHAASPDDRKVVLQSLLQTYYPEQVAVIEHGTYQQLKDTFNSLNVQPSVRSKCLSFFMGAAKASGFKISNYIEDGLKVRGPRKNGVPKKKKGALGKPADQAADTKTGQQDHTPKDMVRVPIPLGAEKTWYITLDKQPNSEDVKRFLQIAGLTFGVEVKQ